MNAPAIAYDDRILSFALPDSSVSIWTLNGRQAIPFVCGERQKALLAARRGETDLAFVGGCDRGGEYFPPGTCKRAILLGGSFGCRARVKPKSLRLG